jgi:hypothetical protein
MGDRVPNIELNRLHNIWFDFYVKYEWMSGEFFI